MIADMRTNHIEATRTTSQMRVTLCALLLLFVWACGTKGKASTGAGGTSSTTSAASTVTAATGSTVSSGTGTSGTSSASSGTGGSVPIDPNAFYVATDGKDANPGTFAEPFATFSRAQTAMRASSAMKTTYVRAGTYTPTATGSCLAANGPGSAIVLGNQDSSETWSFYPPDGYASAVIDGKSTMGASGAVGGDGAGCGIDASNADSVTVVGLHFKNFRYAGFTGYALTNAKILDNEVETTRSAIFGGAGIVVEASPKTTIANNVVHDVAYMGIVVSDNSATGDQMGGATVSGNVVIDSCTFPAVAGGGNDQNGGDCGAIYFWSANPNASSGMVIENNLVRDINISSMGSGDFTGCCAAGVYLDDGVNGVTARGNIVTGIVTGCFQIHGGKDNLFQDNVCDLEAPASSTILFYQTDKWSAAGLMTGNLFEGNVVVAGSAGPGNGFVGDGNPPNPMTIKNNAYFDYATGNVNHGSNGGVGTDANPTIENPGVSCWAPTMSPTSPALSAPVSFPGITGEWGWPGFVVPQTGTAPSWPHGC